jgi:hypothetical protein
MSQVYSALCSFIVVTLLTQLAFGPLAIANTDGHLVAYNADPYWTNPALGGSVDPNKPTSWWNLNSQTNTGNPWSYPGQPQWNSTGPGGSLGWGDGTTSGDNYGLYGHWGTPGTPKATDTLWMKFIRLSGVVNKDYNLMVQQLRESSGYEEDDLIADKIIKDGGVRAAMIGATGSFITSLLNLATQSNAQNNGGTDFGNLISLLGIAPEAAILAVRQMTMVMLLAALYGELPADEDDRVEIAAIPFGVSLGASTINKVLTQLIVKKFMTRQVVQEIGKQAAAQAASQAAVTTGAELIGVAMATQAAAGVTSSVATGKFAKLVKFFVPPLVMALKAITAGAIDYGSTTIIGRHAKNLYRKIALTHRSKTIIAIKSESRAKHALWLVLSRDVFPTTLEEATKQGHREAALEDTKRFAAILDREVPLVVNDRWNELQAMNDDFNSQVSNVGSDAPHSTIIDEYLLTLGKDWDLHAKLYLVQIVLSAMLMKGGLTYHDNEVLDTMAIELRLYPPPKVEVASLKADDPRIDARGRYLQLKRRMQETVALAENQKIQRIKNNGVPTPMRNFSGGQLLLQFIELDDIVKACESLPTTAAIDLCVADQIAKRTAKPR